MTDLPIIFEDNDLLVLNKAAGVIVNRATSHQQISLQDQVSAYLGLTPPPIGIPAPGASAPPEIVFAFRAGMVHRLDKDTSGVILWAKTPAALTGLLQQFQARQVHKTYLCLVHGLEREREGRINLPLARDRRRRQIMSVSPTGRPALTTYEVANYYRTFDAERFLHVYRQNFPDKKLTTSRLTQIYQGFSLIQARPQTGRTHQIRAHFTHLGHPLVGDVAYLPRRKAVLDPLWCPRQFLHAAQIELVHPLTGAALRFEAPLPEDLQVALTWLSSQERP